MCGTGDIAKHSDVMSLRGESFPYQTSNSSYICYECLSLYPHIRVGITSLQENFSVKQTQIRENHIQSRHRVEETSPNGYIYKITPISQAAEEVMETLQEAENQGVCCEIASPYNVRSYTHKVSAT